MKKSKRILSAVLSVAMLMSAFAGMSANAAAKKKIVKSMSVSASKLTLKKGASKTVTAIVKTAKKASAGDLKVTVKSSKASVATVKITKNPAKKATSGKTTIKITAKKAGTATITITAKNLSTKKKTVSKKITVKVTEVKKPVTTQPTTPVEPTTAPVEPTEPVTEPVTDAPVPTDPATEPTSEAPTEPTSEAPTEPTTQATEPATNPGFTADDYSVEYSTVEKTVKFKINKTVITEEELIAQGYTVVDGEATRTCLYGKAVYTFNKLPKTLDELKNFDLKSDVRIVDDTEIDYGMLKPLVASVLAMTTFEKTNRLDTSNPICEMFDYLNGPSKTTALSNATKQFINGQLMDYPDLMNCYFQGATPQNSYTPDKPFKIVVEEGPYYIPAKQTITGSRPTTYMAFIKFEGTDEGERYIDVFKSSDGNWYSWDDQCKHLLASVKTPEEEW